MDLTSTKVLQTSAKQLLALVCKAMAKKDWRPVLIPPLDHPELTCSRPGGKIQGCTLLREVFVSLRLEEQGFKGIGRLGMVYKDLTDKAFPNCGLQYMHSIEHLEVVTPGMVFCWVCCTWYLEKDNWDHAAQCHANHLASKGPVLTTDTFTVMIRLSASLCSSSIPFYLPVQAGSCTIFKLLDHWASSLCTSIAKDIRIREASKNAVKKQLVLQDWHQCLVHGCKHTAPDLKA